MMIKIFENANEPLYKRANYHMMLKEFDLDTQVEILQDMFGDQYSHRILLDVYSFFGGVPYYLKLLWEQQYTTYSLNQLLTDLFFSEFSPLQNEGKEILIEEFGQKYKRFFAILEAIARGNHQRNEIMQKV
ncbi:hypothetical protein FACS1894176_01460 [Bacteroidia bacterium]|nr:hypothetical protein FACS1894176_01460 [Bacteroidia bacterium]